MKKIHYSDITSFKVIFYFLLCIFAIPFYFKTGGVWWSFLIVLTASLFFNSCYIIGWHRWLCHRSFTPHIFGKYLMLLSLIIQGNHRPLYIIAAHRLHHKFPDQEEDPHSPKHRNFFQAWLGRFRTNPILLIDQVKSCDIKNKELMFVQRNYYKLFFIFYTLFFLIDIKTAMLFLSWSFTYVNLSTALVVQYSHFTKDGVNYETRNSSRIFSTLTMGEGLHKNHHDKPGAWNLSNSEHPHDTGAKFIKLFLMKKAPY